MAGRADTRVVAVSAIVVIGTGVDAHVVANDHSATVAGARVAPAAATLRAEVAAATEIGAAATASIATTIVAAGADPVFACLRIGIARVEAHAAVGEVVRENDAVIATDRVTAGAAFIVGTPAGAAFVAGVALAMQFQTRAS